MSRMNVVYRIVSDCGRFYVGSTGNFLKRITKHFVDLKAGKHHNVNLQELYDAGGKFNTTFAICMDREQAYEMEELIIRDYEGSSFLLNIGRSAQGGDNFTLHPHREKIRLKYALAMVGLTEEERKRRFSNPGARNGMFGKTHTEEVRQVIAVANKGNVYRLGFKASDKTRERMSIIASQRFAERNPFYGKQHSAETKKRIAETKKGIKPTNANRIEINGVIYRSQVDAAKALGVSGGTITFRLNSKNKRFSSYRVIEEIGSA